MLDKLLINAINNARILGIFKTFCENNVNIESQRRIRNILSISNNVNNTINEMIKREQKVILNDFESKRLLELIIAFLNKKSFRTPVKKELKDNLLKSQNYKCAICNCNIDNSSHADHIVPFKYVGDCLKNNLQLLCEHCNESKNDSLDYQIKYLLKLL